MPATASSLPRPPCSSCLRRQASHFIHHACDGQLSAASPMLVMPAKAGIALHPPCLRRPALCRVPHARHACEGRHRISSTMPATASSLPRPHARHACEGRHRTSCLRRSFQAGQSFRLPAAAELLSLCVLKEKVAKEKEHPAWRLPGIGQLLPALPQLGHPCPRLPGKSVSRGRASRQGILPWRKGADIPVGSRCAACRPRLTAAQGPRVEQRAILARTRCAAASRSREQGATAKGTSSIGQKRTVAISTRLPNSGRWRLANTSSTVSVSDLRQVPDSIS